MIPWAAHGPPGDGPRARAARARARWGARGGPRARAAARARARSRARPLAPARARAVTAAACCFCLSVPRAQQSRGPQRALLTHSSSVLFTLATLLFTWATLATLLALRAGIDVASRRGIWRILKEELAAGGFGASAVRRISSPAPRIAV